MENKISSMNLQEDNKSVRTYYIAGSTLLHNALIMLDYSCIRLEGNGLNEVKTYIRNNLQVKSGFHEVEIGVITSKKPFYIKRYNGSSISKKLLESFTNKE